MMAAEENHHACKRSRVGNCVIGPVAEAGDGGLRQWYHPSSRIFRVSRASGGKDRHSKVYTAKGLRDRRVRLSVSTAIQFYDLQDRLGFDQPSKAIEWLIKAASSSIAELPTLESSFPESLNLHEEKPEMERELDLGQQQQQQQQQQHLSLTKSGCSSNSETSKGSVLSLSRPNNRLKARERARERAAKDKEKEELEAAHHQNVNNHQSSFTELLTGGNGAPIAENPNADCVRKQIRYLPITAGADYFTQVGLFGEPHQASSGFSSQSHIGMVPLSTGGDHPEMQQFSFLQDHPVAVATMAGDYNLNFSISSGLSGFNRGTLQSNSSSQLPHHHHHLHRLSSPADRSSLPFFFGGAAPLSSVSASAESQLPASFDGRLQLCYSDDYSHSDMKGKGKS